MIRDKVIRKELFPPCHEICWGFSGMAQRSTPEWSYPLPKTLPPILLRYCLPYIPWLARCHLQLNSRLNFMAHKFLLIWFILLLGKASQPSRRIRTWLERHQVQWPALCCSPFVSPVLCFSLSCLKALACSWVLPLMELDCHDVFTAYIPPCDAFINTANQLILSILFILKF